jgi:dTDP-4-amino-4,6-dideoxygalactose transaminase
VPAVRDDTGRTLVTRRIAVALTKRHPTVVHRAVEPVACDVETHTLLIDVDELAEKLAGKKTRTTIPSPRAPRD